MPSQRQVREIAAQMIALVPADALEDLQNEDPVLAVEVHYELITVHRLPAAHIAKGDCVVDGYYDPFIDPEQPRILYSDAVVPERARLTIVHELGHHIFNTTGAHLLDDLDRIAGSAQEACQLEERVCQRFAGEVLVPERLLDEIINGDAVKPQHVMRLRQMTNASWEVLALRAVQHAETRLAVALIRQQGEVAFVASTGMPGWPRDSAVQPGGPLDRALRYDSRWRPDMYRYDLGGAEQLYCDTTRVDERLAIAVMSPRRSDGGLSALEVVEPAWKTREESCEWCGEERDVSWCDHCSGRRCRSCGRCGCQKPIENQVCPECHLENPSRPGARVCRDCEADGVA